MDLYDVVSKKLGMDLIEYIDYHRKNPPKVEIEDDNYENPLDVLTLEEIELFQEYALMTLKNQQAPRAI